MKKSVEPFLKETEIKKLATEVKSLIIKTMTDYRLKFEDLSDIINDLIDESSITIIKKYKDFNQWGKIVRSTDDSFKSKSLQWWMTLKTIVERIPDYIEKQNNILQERTLRLTKKIKDPFKRDFFETMQNQIKKHIAEKTPFHFFKELSDKYYVKDEELLAFFVANPILIFSEICKEFAQTEEEKNYFPYVSKVYHFTSTIDTDIFKEANEDFDDYYNKNFNVSFTKKNNSPGIILGHSLSSYSDSLCLLYELGRFKRMSDIFDANHKIYLTAPSWARFNRNASEIHDDEEKRLKVLKQCLVYREKLYDFLNIDIDKCEEDAIVSEKRKKRISHKMILKFAKEYAEYSDFIKKIEIKEQEKTKHLLEIIESLCSADNSDIFNDLLPPELKILTFSIVEDKKNLFVIHTILKHFNSLDQNTFYYTLLQRFKQQEYKGWMKIAVDSERKFDAAFIKLDKVDGYEDISLGALYFRQYYFAKGKDQKPLNIIPYSFPSGRLWRRAAPDINKAIDNAILLWDFEEGREQKIRRIIAEIDLVQLAIQMSDLFSFCNYFFKDDFWKGKIEDNGEHIKGLDDYLNEIDAFCAKSWAKYRKSPELIRTFCQYFLTMWYDEMDLPYYFYPFLHIKKAINDEEFEKFLRTVYSEIIIYILTQVNSKINIKEWK